MSRPRRGRFAWSAGLVAGALDTALVLLRPGLPRGWVARALALAGAFASASVLVAVGARALAWSAGRLDALAPGARRSVLAFVSLLLGVAVSFGAFRGAGVRRSGLGPVLTVLTVLFALAAGLVLARRYEALARHVRSPRGRAVLGVAALATYAAHAFVYPRQYALLHAITVLMAVLFATAARPPSRASAPASVLALVALSLLGLRESARAHVGRTAPLGASVLTVLGPLYRLATPRPAAESASHEAESAGPSLPLAGLDVVLLTVDALRADRLGAYGGPAGLTPAIDAMARQGVVVERAYCTTPHTSYSLASLMTGKFFREVSALGPAAQAHATIASLLRGRGYTSTALFPPAVFFVDADRLGALRTEGFGFDERVEAYASADERVQQVDAVLARAPRDRPLLLWVHFFEPHEPYEPHGSQRADAPARARYDAEVASVDAAVGAIRERFAARHRRALFVLTADHGEEFGEHGGRFHGTTLYDEQVRVPLVFQLPGVLPRRVAGPASLVDVLPTLAAGVGLARDRRVRGRDIGPWLLGARVDGTGRAFSSVGTLRAVIDGREKLVCDASDGACELYALEHDPLERENLIDRADVRVAALRAELDRWSGTHGGFERAALGARAVPAAVVVTTPTLERALQGERAVARGLAAELGTLRGVARARAIDALATLADEDASVRAALGRIAEASPDPTEARRASIALARLGDARGARAAREALSSSDRDEALAGALGLARLDDDAGRAVLERVARDVGETDARRDAALDALERAQGRARDASLTLWSALLDDPRVGPRAARALGTLGDRRALGALEALLTRTPYALTRQAALESALALDVEAAHRALPAALAASEPLPEPLRVLEPLREPGLLVRGAAPHRRGVLRATTRHTIALAGPPVRGPAVALVSWERGEPAAAVRDSSLEIEGFSVSIDGARGWARIPFARAPSRLRIRSTEPVRIGLALVVAAAP